MIRLTIEEEARLLKKREKNRIAAAKYRAKNLQKWKDIRTDWYRRNKDSLVYKETQAQKMRRWLYGLTEPAYQKLVIQAKERCMICGSKEKLHIDHDHESGQVRGLLCRACNHGLGNFKDDEQLLYGAIDYLRRVTPSSD